MAETETVGDYVLERELGRGGMGVVYAGVHKLVGSRVAVKVLLPELSRKQDLVQRFFNEARASARIRHPSIVDIHGFGYAGDGNAYIVMELLEGETLAGRLKARGAMPIVSAVALARQVANALAAAHGAGIVHRDLKPDNVFLVKDPEVVGGERVKLLDFGIAKLATDNAGPTRTVTGAILGTPHYMSPEQCEGAREVDGRTDLYSLGCMLFQMLSGVLPFDSPGVGGLIGMHLHVPPPLLRSRCPHASVELEDLIARLLAKPVEERFQSAEAVANALAIPAVSATVTPSAGADPFVTTARAPGGVTPAELGVAATIHTPSAIAAGTPIGMPGGAAAPAPTTHATGGRVPTEIDRQARAETVAATDPSVVPNLRPPTLPVEAQAAGKPRSTPTRGDNPTVPSLPPDMTAPPVRATTTVARRGRVIVVVTVLVMGLGVFALVQFNTGERAGGGDGGGRPADVVGTAGLDAVPVAGGTGERNGSGTGGEAPIPVVPADPTLPGQGVDMAAVEKMVQSMKTMDAPGDYTKVKAVHDRLYEATASCGEPCADVRAAADEMMQHATTQALDAAEQAITKRKKKGDCKGAERELTAARAKIGAEADKLKALLDGCKQVTAGGTTAGSATGGGSGSGDGGEGGFDAFEATGKHLLAEMIAGKRYDEAIAYCLQRKRKGPGVRQLCAIAACRAGRTDQAKQWLKGFSRAQVERTLAQCTPDGDAGNANQQVPPTGGGAKK